MARSRTTLVLRGQIINDGLIQVNDVGSGSAEVVVDGNATLDGTGIVRVLSAQVNRVRGVNAGDTLTLEPGQRLAA